MRLKTTLPVLFAIICAAQANIKLPNYQFKYTVNDPNTNDHKVQVERKIGDHLTTAYVVKTLHPVPPNGAQPGNSYIGVSRWSGDKAGPIVPVFPKDHDSPPKLHPFIHKFGIGHKMGLYPNIPKPVKPPITVKIPSYSIGWPKDDGYKGKVEYHRNKDSHSYHSSDTDYKKDKPKPNIYIIVEKRPAPLTKEIYHLGSKIYKPKPYIGDKTPSEYSINYDWPKRYGLSKFDYNTKLLNTDFDKDSKYDAYFPGKDVDSHDIPIRGYKEPSKYDFDDKSIGYFPYKHVDTHDDEKLDDGKRKGLYHSYSWGKRYGTGDYEKDSNNDDKEEEEKDDSDDEYEQTEYEERPKSIEKSNTQSYAISRSHKYGDDDDDDVNKGHEDDDHEDEKDGDRYGTTVYNWPSYFKHGQKEELDSGKWFHDKRKGNDDGYKSYDFDHEDRKKRSH